MCEREREDDDEEVARNNDGELFQGLLLLTADAALAARPWAS